MHYEPRAITRMAESNHTAFVFKFKNAVTTREGKQTWSYSETIRMFNIKDNSDLYYSGRVHENLEESLQAMQEKGTFKGVPYYPHETLNSGLAGTPEMMVMKLTRYTLALEKQLEENPFDGGAWCALGMQFLNDDDTENAKKCFEYSCLSNVEAYLPFRELSLMYLNLARKSMLLALKNCFPTHHHYPKMAEIVNFLNEVSPQPLVIDTGDIKVSDIIEELPEFPLEKLAVRDGVQISGQN